MIHILKKAVTLAGSASSSPLCGCEEHQLGDANDRTNGGRSTDSRAHFQPFRTKCNQSCRERARTRCNRDTRCLVNRLTQPMHGLERRWEAHTNTIATKTSIQVIYNSVPTSLAPSQASFPLVFKRFDNDGWATPDFPVTAVVNIESVRRNKDIAPAIM
jgi:hypothetical protein